MNAQQNKVVVLNKTLKNFGSLGKKEDSLFLFEGNLILNGRTLVAKMCDDGILIGISGGKLQAQMINILNVLDGIHIQLVNKQLILNGQLWTGELTYLNQDDGSWKYRIE